MNVLIGVLRELIGLFVDDGSLALMILAVVILAGIFVTLAPDLQLAAGRTAVWLPRRPCCECGKSRPSLVTLIRPIPTLGVLRAAPHTRKADIRPNSRVTIV
jgi:hypothetical protein